MKSLAVLVGVVVLAGCGPREPVYTLKTLDEKKAECVSFGFVEGTEQFGQCLLIVTQADIQAEQRALDRDQARRSDAAEAFQRGMNQAADSLRNNNSLNCTSNTVGTQTYTNCY